MTAEEKRPLAFGGNAKGQAKKDSAARLPHPQAVSTAPIGGTRAGAFMGGGRRHDSQPARIFLDRLPAGRYGCRTKTKRAAARRLKPGCFFDHPKIDLPQCPDTVRSGTPFSALVTLGHFYFPEVHP